MPTNLSSTQANEDSERPMQEEGGSEPTFDAEPVQAPTKQLRIIRTRFRCISKKDQQKYPHYPQVRFEVFALKAKRKQHAVDEAPILQSPEPLGPTDFASSSTALLARPRAGQVQAVLEDDQLGRPEHMQQSLVQMLHTSGRRLGFVPQSRCSAAPPSVPGLQWKECSQQNPRGHPFIAIDCFAPQQVESECATPPCELANLDDVLVFATPKQTPAQSEADSDAEYVAETSDTN